jgi:hypothetical protein
MGAIAFVKPRVAIKDVQNKEVVLKVLAGRSIGLVLEEQPQAPRIYIVRFEQITRGKGKGAAGGGQVSKRNPIEGLVPIGAYLVQVNGKQTTRLSLEEVTRIIQQSDGSHHTLKFRY